MDLRMVLQRFLQREGTDLTEVEGRYVMEVPPHGVAMLRIAAVPSR
jgi:hypothetical protein